MKMRKYLSPTSLIRSLAMMAALTTCLAGLANPTDGDETEKRSSDKPLSVLTDLFEIESLTYEFLTPTRGVRGTAVEGDIPQPTPLPYDEDLLLLGKIVAEGKFKKGIDRDIDKCRLDIEFEATPLVDIRSQDFLRMLREEGKIDWKRWSLHDEPNKSETASQEESIGDKEPRGQSDIPETKKSGEKTDLFLPKSSVTQGTRTIKETIEFDLPKQRNEKKLTIPFKVIWKPNKPFRELTYYEVRITNPQEAKTAQVGVFQNGSRALAMDQQVERFGNNLRWRILGPDKKKPTDVGDKK